MFQPFLSWQRKLYQDIGDWYASVDPVVSGIAGDSYYALAASSSPFMWDITPEVDIPNVIGRTKETNLFTLDKLYAPLSKSFASSVQIGQTSNTQTLTSNAGVAVGDTLYFPKSAAYVTVTGIGNLLDDQFVTLSQSITTTTGDPVYIPQVLDGWALIMRTPGSQLYGGIWYVQGNPQIFEHFMPHQAVLLKRGNAGRGMPLR